MSFDPTQVYSATYSNVPVFEFVTEEGPIMRRKSDSWINATHILKIAKFPKARRTRVLEKDVQTGIHEKVQGGYGKYQGTYVPLDIGKEIAITFGVYDILKPIFDFEFIEGKSETPPPAPKHNHASASNVGRKLQQKVKNESFSDAAILAKRTRSGPDLETSPKRRARPKRVTLSGRAKPDINRSQTVPIDSSGPSIGTFSSKNDHGVETSFKLPPLQRQDTEKDPILFSIGSMNIRRDDLEPESCDDLDADKSSQTHTLKSEKLPYPSGLPSNDHPDQRFGINVRDSYDDELMSGRELFGSHDSASKDTFDKYVPPPSRGSDSMTSLPDTPQLLGSASLRSFPSQRHSHPHLNSNSLRGDAESVEYFNILLNYLLEESPGSSQNNRTRTLASNLPEKVLNPPQPLSRIIIDQPIDSDGNTIFHWSCAMANAPMIEFFLTLFSDTINAELQNFRGETPLMFLVQFNNSYLLNNFAAIFDMLFDSVLATDNFGRTILHQIALACEPPTDAENGHSDATLIKESFAKYYFEVILAKMVKFPDFQLHNEKQALTQNNKKDVMVKFINHQDNEGNTALHIVAFSLARRCIRTFIRYHVYIDFGLRNLVNCTIEDYLASHNYVLRLEGENDELLPLVGGTMNGNTITNPTYGAQSFESQMLSTRLALSMQASVAHRVTEQLSKLSFLVEKELKEYDEKILNLLEYYKLVGHVKIESQKEVLKLFNLDYLLEDAEREFENNLLSSQQESKFTDPNERSNDYIIQEEIKRLTNDLCFQYLALEYEFENKFKEYLELRERKVQGTLQELQSKSNTDGGEANVTDQEKIDLVAKLQKQIMERKKLSRKIYQEELNLPYAAQFPEEFKENYGNGSRIDGNTGPDAGKNNNLMIAGFPKSDKLYKYCKLISLSCGMTFAEVENSVDLIEQSLARSVNKTG